MTGRPSRSRRLKRRLRVRLLRGRRWGCWLLGCRAGGRGWVSLFPCRVCLTRFILAIRAGWPVGCSGCFETGSCMWAVGGAGSGRIGNIGSRQPIVLASCTTAWGLGGSCCGACTCVRLVVAVHLSQSTCARVVRTTNTPASGQQQQHASGPRARREPSSRRFRSASHGR